MFFWFISYYRHLSLAGLHRAGGQGDEGVGNSLVSRLTVGKGEVVGLVVERDFGGLAEIQEIISTAGGDIYACDGSWATYYLIKVLLFHIAHILECKLGHVCNMQTGTVVLKVEGDGGTGSNRRNLSFHHVSGIVQGEDAICIEGI